MTAPTVSLLLPASGDVATTLRVLEALARLPEEPAFEVVVVVAEGDVETRALTDGLEGDVQVVLDRTPSGFGDAYDKAARVAGAGVLVLLSPTAVPADGWLDDLLGGLEGADAALPRSLAHDGADLPAGGWLALAVRATAYARVGGVGGTRQAGRAEKETLVAALGTVATVRASVLLTGT